MQTKFSLQRQAIPIDDTGSIGDTTSTTTTATTAVVGTSRNPTVPATGASGAQTREQARRKRLLKLSSGPTPQGVDGVSPLRSTSYQSPPYTAPPISSHSQELIPIQPGSRRGSTAIEEHQKAVGVPSQPPSMQLPPGFSREYWVSDDSNMTTSTGTLDADYQTQEPEFNPRTSTLSPSTSFTSQQQHPSKSTGALVNSNSSGPQHSNSGTWRRRLTKTRSLTTMAGSVKRSFSTPNVQRAAAAAVAVAAAVAMSDSTYAADKRRNKLGYHRTSVACVHCRRRKIRCLLAKDDSQGRCQNCIRLKKECNFYPVEATDRRPRSMSKPDITSQEPASEASSPSPGDGALGPVPSTEPPRGYPSSVPVTPTYDFVGSFDESFRNRSISSASGQVSLPRSTNVSRKSSLAQMHAMPLALKIEQGYLSPCDGFPRAVWEQQSENTTPVSDAYRRQEDTAAAYWRLTSSGVHTTPFTPHQNPDAMASLTSLDSIELQDESVWRSQVSSRIGSIDQGMLPAYALGSYPSDPDFACATPGLVSASASTASLTASISEAPSQYAGGGGEGGGGGSALGQCYTNQWGGGDPCSSYELDSLMKMESFDSVEPSGSFYMDEDTQYPLHAHPVQISHV